MSERRFRRYPVYKDSGVEWLGEIPVGWDVKRADAFLTYEKVPVEPSSISDELVFHFSIPSVQATGNGALESPSEIDSAKLRIVGERLLVSKLNPRKGVVLVATEKDVPTLCSTEFVPFEVRGSVLRWAMYLFLAESTRQRLSAVVRSATRSHQRAEVSEIVKMWHGVPSLPEQRAIAAFLDRETARIDALVARKERLIELLQEQRTALITRAVTKGLDPNVPMKDSGVEWLREIPAHWDALGFKRLVDPARPVTYGIVQCGPDYPGGVPYIRPVDMDDEGGIRAAHLQRTAPGIAASYARSTIRPGDVVVSIGPSFGKAMIVPAELDGANLTQGTARLAPGNRITSRFMLWALRSNSIWQAWDSLCSGATFRALTLETLENCAVALPPVTEQQVIIAVLNMEAARIDALIAKVRAAIDRLKELRTALISAAVTGKIDVREEAA